MAKFFIDRPIFAWVVALFIIVLGGIALTKLPIAQYPKVAPPAIVINTAYPGASAKVLEDSVLSVIEREMNGSPGLVYMESVAQADRSEEHTSELQSPCNLVCRLLLEKKKKDHTHNSYDTPITPHFVFFFF